MKEETGYENREPISIDSRQVVIFQGQVAGKCDLRLNELSKEFHDDIIVLICDGAAWHKAGKLMVPDNIAILFIPPYTPEMNPIEQIWKELRAKGFFNEVFASLEKVVDRLCETINHLAKELLSALLGVIGLVIFLT